MLINFRISLLTKRFFLSFDRHCDKTVTFSELLQDVNNFSKTIVDVIRKSHEFSFKIIRVIRIVVSNPVNFLVCARQWRQSNASWCSMTSGFSPILLLSPPSYILYTLLITFFPPSSSVSLSYFFLTVQMRKYLLNTRAWVFNKHSCISFSYIHILNGTCVFPTLKLQVKNVFPERKSRKT